jgi:hypothetical protein
MKVSAALLDRLLLLGCFANSNLTTEFFTPLSASSRTVVVARNAVTASLRAAPATTSKLFVSEKKKPTLQIVTYKNTNNNKKKSPLMRLLVSIR